jgi:glycosyltransferase involved in cell wall biosynthesis
VANEMNSGRAMISVCMATYNGMPFLVDQVNSILDQLGKYDELIVSDDGSFDDTRKWLLALKDSRIRLVENTFKKGPVGNFQNALSHAEGDFIFLSDQDDVWCDNKVERIAALLKEYELVVSDCSIINEEGITLDKSFFLSRHSGAGIFRNLYKNSYLGCCMAFRSELLKVALPFPDGIYMHDWWLGLVAETVGKVYFLPEPLVQYRRHQHNFSETWTGSKNSLAERIRIRISVGLPLVGICGRFMIAKVKGANNEPSHFLGSNIKGLVDMKCLNCDGVLITEDVQNQIWDTRFGIRQEYQIGVCASCGLEQTIPLPNQAEMNKLYEQYYNFSGENNTRYTQIRAMFINSFLYRIWLAIDGDISFHRMSGAGSLLDVGCNEGRGLEFYQSHGFATEGLELNSKAAEVARAKGFTVHGSTLESFSEDKKYDVVVLSNVLEHSLDPGSMLQHIHRLLNPNGQIWISCPNSQSWLRTAFGRFWINWHVPFHVVHFSPDTLREVLKKAQFEIVNIRQETPALWVASSIIAGLFAKPGQPTKQLRSAALMAMLMLLIRGLGFPLLWLGNLSKRGDCLVVVTRKN